MSTFGEGSQGGEETAMTAVGGDRQQLQRMKDWENATIEYNRTASAPLQEEVLVAVLISRSPKEVGTYLHVQVREETAS